MGIVDWINLVLGRDRWQTLVNAVMKIRCRIFTCWLLKNDSFSLMELSCGDVDGSGVAERRAGRLNFGLLAGKYSDLLSSSSHCP